MMTGIAATRRLLRLDVIATLLTTTAIAASAQTTPSVEIANRSIGDVVPGSGGHAPRE